MNGIARLAGVAGGRPCVQGTGIETAVLIDRFLGGDRMADLAKDYDLTLDQVEAAIRFECCRACPCEACAWAMKTAMSTPKPAPKPPVPVCKPKRTNS